MQYSILKRLLESPKGATLLWIYLSAGVGVFSLTGVAHILYLYLCILFILLGSIMDYKNFYPIKRLFLNLLGITITIYFASQLSLENVVEPLSNLLITLIGIKFLEEKKPRDMYQILILSLLSLSLATLYNLSISFLILLMLFSLLGITSLVFINAYKQNQKNYQPLEIFGYYSTASVFLFLAVPLLSVPFFVFLPRTQFPLFDVFGRKDGLKTGIAGEVSLGKVGEIQQDNTVAFRVFGLPKNIREPYWRVQVFDTYENNKWISTLKESFSPLKGMGEVSYTIVLEPHYEDYLPLLDFPYSISSLEGVKGQVFVGPGGTFKVSTNVNKAIRYIASSVSEPVSSYETLASAYIYVPKQIPESIRKLARGLTSGAVDEGEKVRRVVKHFAEGGYSYTLRLEKYEGDPLEYFLFVSKKGNCEYYASATALLLRLMGIPARVVGGFKGALWNDYGKYHVVTNSMAHVWVEAYLKGRWVRIDTTPSYQSPAVKRISSFSLLKDAIVSFWYTNVIGFSVEKQISVFKAFGKGAKWSVKRENLMLIFKYILLVLLLATPFYLIFLYYTRFRKTPENLYKRLTQVLGSKEEPERLLEKFKSKSFYHHLEYIVRLYQRHRYSNYKVYTDEIKRGYRALEEIKKSPQ